MGPLQSITPLARQTTIGMSHGSVPPQLRPVRFGNDSNPVDKPGGPPPETPVDSVQTGAADTVPAAEKPSTEQAPVAAPEPPKTWWQRVRSFPSTFRTVYKEFKEYLKSDDATRAKGLFFKRILPLMIGVCAFIPGYGLLIGILGTIPSYFSGRYGARVLEKLKDKAQTEDSSLMKQFSRIDELLDNPQKAKDPDELFNLVSRFIEDALDIRMFPALKKLAVFIKPTKDNLLGKALMRYNRAALWAKVNLEVAEAESVGGAAWKGVKGGMHHFIVFKLLPTIGKFIENGSKFAPGFLKPFFWVTGWCLEWFGLLKLGADMMMTSPEPAKPAKA